MKFKGLKLKGLKTPISAHPIFSPIVALWFAAFLGFGSLIVPVALYEKIFSVTGISSIITATSAPLGMTARLLIAFVAAMGGAALGFLLARKVGMAQSASVPGTKPNRITKRKLSTPLGESVKRPISAREELGSNSLDEPVTAEEFERAEPPRQRRRPLSVTDDTGADDRFDAAPLPGDDFYPHRSASTDTAPEFAPEENRNDRVAFGTAQPPATTDTIGDTMGDTTGGGSSFASFADNPQNLGGPIQVPIVNEDTALENRPEEFKAPEFSGPAPAYNPDSSDVDASDPYDSDAIGEASVLKSQMTTNRSPNTAPYMHEEQSEMSDSLNTSNGTYNPFSSHAANPQSAHTPFTPPPFEDAAPLQPNDMQQQPMPEEFAQEEAVFQEPAPEATAPAAPTPVEPTPMDHMSQGPASDAPPLYGQANMADTPDEGVPGHDIFSALKAAIKAESVVEDEASFEKTSEVIAQDTAQTLPKSAPKNAPEYAPNYQPGDVPGEAAANELRSRPLDDLGMVELVERFAVALQSADQEQNQEQGIPSPVETSAPIPQPAPVSALTPISDAAPVAPAPAAAPQASPAVSTDEQVEPATILRQAEHVDQPDIAPTSPQAEMPAATAAPAPIVQSEQGEAAADHNPMSAPPPLQAAAPVPAPFQPLDYDEEDCESEDASSDIDSLVLDLGRHLSADAPQPTSYVPDLGQTDDQLNGQINEQLTEQVNEQATQQASEQAVEQINEQPGQMSDEEITNEAYSSLLAMKSSFSEGNPFPRIEEEVDEQADYAEPVVVFPGQEQRRATPASDGPVRDPLPQGREHLNPRPFDGPSQPAPAANAAVDPALCQDDTQRSLREALERLQGTGGASS